MARVLFIQTGWMEHVGILYLAAVLRRAGHQCTLVITKRPKVALRVVRRDKPDLIALSATTGNHYPLLLLGRAVRAESPAALGLPKTPLVIMGGPHATFFPEVIEDAGLDLVCRGEGEGPILDLCTRIDKGEDFTSVPGLWAKRDEAITRNPLAPLIEDLDSLPFPDRSLYEETYPFFRKISMKRVVFTRGCPYKCTYCYNAILRELLRGLGRYLRHRSVENVIEELKELKAAGARTINVSDDTFAVNKKWTLEFLDRYAAEVALPFIVNARAELLDEEVTRQLGVAGCHCVQVGVESGSQEMRDSMLGRPLPDETLIQAAERAHGAGIRLLTYNMVGLPGETLDQAFKTMRINTLMKTEFPRVSIFQPYPGTPLGDQAREMGLVRDGADMGRFSDSYFRSSVLSQPDIEAMVNLQKFFYPAIRFPRLEPVIRRLIKLPPNLLFQALYLVSIGAQYMRATRRTPLEMLRFGLKNLGSY